MSASIAPSLGPVAAHSAQVEAKPALRPQQREQAAPSAAPSAEARPQLTHLPANVEELKAKPRPGYAEMAEHLEPLIQAQLAEVKQVLADKKLGAADVSFVYGIDITGKELSVCLACGVVGHDFQPTMMRQENPAIDMLSESLVVFLEVAARLGVAHGVLAYDDQGVLTLREVTAPKNQTERGLLVDRFQKFKDRFDKVQIGGRVRSGVVTDQTWLAAEAKSWKPSDANRKVAGEPDDRQAVDEVMRMYAAAGTRTALRGALFAKSQVPTASVKTAEAIARSKGVQLGGVAIGAEAAAIKSRFFARTDVAPTMHDLRAHMGSGIKQLIKQSDEK